MKKLFLSTVLGMGLCCSQPAGHAQQYKEHISKQFTLQSGVVAIYNVSGSVKVEGYSGDKVIFEVDKTISADDSRTLEEGKKEFKLEFEQVGDSVIAYISAPYDSRPHRNSRNWDNHRRIEYHSKLEFTVKVPNSMSLDVGTVNDGNVVVKDVGGSLKVNNVNGSITIENAKGTTRAHTVNGGVTVTYLGVPPEPSSYYSVNGALKVSYPANLNADFEFKTMNGQYYTDFPNVEILPTKVTKTENKNGEGTVYKLNKNSGVRIGSGGKLFKFETLNGNIYITKHHG